VTGRAAAGTTSAGYAAAVVATGEARVDVLLSLGEAGIELEPEKGGFHWVGQAKLQKQQLPQGQEQQQQQHYYQGSMQRGKSRRCLAFSWRGWTRSVI
jgi:hypothetical protein